MIGGFGFGGESPGLLVSVRSAAEAIEAVRGGAAVIDIKEPWRGPLGEASAEVWKEVRQVVAESIRVSVALGELAQWEDRGRDYRGIHFRKLGLAGAGIDWRARWEAIVTQDKGHSRWVAVAYADWVRAEAPDPAAVLEAALGCANCSGVLVDTWDKTRPGLAEPTQEWIEWVGRARQAGRFVALAGGLDRSAIRRLAPLRPDLFAVRGAACRGNDRTASISADQVAELVQVIQDSRRSMKIDGMTSGI